MIFDGKSSEYLEYKGFPVGLLDFTQFAQHEIDLPDEFLMLFLSDGVLEILEEQNSGKQQEYIKNLIDSFDTGIDNVISSIKLDISSMQPDDLTFMIIKKEKFYG